MTPPCKIFKYKKKRRSKIRIRRPYTSDLRLPPGFNDLQHFYSGEGEFGDFAPSSRESTGPRLNPNLVALRKWLEKEKFIPQDLSDEFLTMFLKAESYDVEQASKRMKKYFYVRQEASFLFRERDPSSCENEKIFKKLYVLPMPNTTEDNRRVILTGLVDQTITYNQLDHVKALAMVLDLLIWERDVGFCDFDIVFDGRGFDCPQLLENKVYNHRAIKSLILDTIPGTLRSFCLFIPPLHVSSVANSRDGIWINVVKCENELIERIPPDVLPVEFGGYLGHFKELLGEWEMTMLKNRKFFLSFEKRMANDYRKRLCYEKEVRERGKNWVQNWKLVADEWEYKVRYYERMRHAVQYKHPAFGPDKIQIKPKQKPFKDPLKKCREMAKQDDKKAKMFEASNLYVGYAKEIKKAQLEAEKEKQKQKQYVCYSPVLELDFYWG